MPTYFDDLISSLNDQEKRELSKLLEADRARRNERMKQELENQLFEVLNKAEATGFEIYFSDEASGRDIRLTGRASQDFYVE